MKNYEKAYKDMREVFDDPCVEKALKFATENPITVYGINSIEYESVTHGFFDLYFSVSRSTVEDDGA
ncbi:MAG: hypothetical protein AAB283_01445 [Planctomycetota bacterium]|nr:hypothetical protein [Nitrospirota bacterium]